MNRSAAAHAAGRDRIAGPPAATSPTRAHGRSTFRLASGTCALIAVIAGALLAPVLALHDPLGQDLAASLAPPSGLHPLGADALGRDVLARLLFGARLSLAVGLVATAASVAVGTALGAIAGYGRPAVDELLTRVTDVFLAFPGLLLAIALAAVLGPSARNVAIALALMGWPTYARVVRAEVRAAATLDSVRAAEALGASALRIRLRHLLPAAAPALAIQAAFGLGGAIVAESSLSFLGLGAPPPTPSWGAMLAEGRSLLVVAPHLAIAPAVAVGVTILAVHLVGDALAQRWQRGQ